MHSTKTPTPWRWTFPWKMTRLSTFKTALVSWKMLQEAKKHDLQCTNEKQLPWTDSKVANSQHIYCKDQLCYKKNVCKEKTAIVCVNAAGQVKKRLQ